jgi:beta-carotene ketolase (CrtO type)
VTDVIVIGGGHNGLACGAYLARAGLSVTVLERAPEPGGCIATVELPDGRGRLELGAYVHGGIRASGVAADLELERHGLRFHLRDEVILSPCDDGSALAFHSSLERTVAGLAEVVGPGDAEAYRRFAAWSAAASAVIDRTQRGPAPTLRELGALSEAALGAREGARLVQALLASASNLLRGTFSDERLRGALGHWAAHSQQPPGDPGTSVGAIAMAGGHGQPMARPAGGSRATVDALAASLRAAGGELRCGVPVERVETSGGRAVAVHAGGERLPAARAVVSAIDARRLFFDLMGPDDVPAALRDELRRIHVGGRNVSELKVDAILAGPAPLPGPPGFAGALMLSPNTLADMERAFAEIQLGRVPGRPTVMIGFPSALEPGWAPEGRGAVWLSAFVPWHLEEGPWTAEALEAASDAVWATAERALGAAMPVSERRITGPDDWVARTGNSHACPNHVEMSVDQLLAARPSPSLARYRTPVAGLYLSGAGTHPGGGVTGLPGRNAAREIQADLGLLPRARGARLRAQAAMLRDAARAAWALRRAA